MKLTCGEYSNGNSHLSGPAVHSLYCTVHSLYCGDTLILTVERLFKLEYECLPRITCEFLNSLVSFSPPVILGVTNPFFAKTLQHWPHILRIGAMNNLG